MTSTLSPVTTLGYQRLWDAVVHGIPTATFFRIDSKISGNLDLTASYGEEGNGPLHSLEEAQEAVSELFFDAYDADCDLDWVSSREARIKWWDSQGNMFHDVWVIVSVDEDGDEA